MLVPDCEQDKVLQKGRDTWKGSTVHSTAGYLCVLLFDRALVEFIQRQLAGKVWWTSPEAIVLSPVTQNTDFRAESTMTSVSPWKSKEQSSRLRWTTGKEIPWLRGLQSMSSWTVRWSFGFVGIASFPSRHPPPDLNVNKIKYCLNAAAAWGSSCTEVPHICRSWSSSHVEKEGVQAQTTSLLLLPDHRNIYKEQW